MRRRPRIALALAAALAVAASPLAAQVWAGGRLRIVAPNPEDVEFGRAVAVLDFDGDGDLEIAIGDPSTDKVEDAPLPAVRLYHRTGAGWEEWISARIGAVWFGTVLAVGDFNEDDRQDLLIGAPGDSNGGGAVYWWHKTDSDSSFGSVLTTLGAADGEIVDAIAAEVAGGERGAELVAGLGASFDIGRRLMEEGAGRESAVAVAVGDLDPPDRVVVVEARARATGGEIEVIVAVEIADRQA
ncbi:MAG TPA: FG-GAP repeat protein, partial [Thermoanaerobaculia bacterium]|nr:FG-GAP repeat protein [Thermoanaerobaculia bacterium]